MTFDRKTRAKYAAAYYDKGSTILVVYLHDLGLWLRHLPTRHIKLIERIDCGLPCRKVLQPSRMVPRPSRKALQPLLCADRPVCWIKEKSKR